MADHRRKNALGVLGGGLGRRSAPSTGTRAAHGLTTRVHGYPSELSENGERALRAMRAPFVCHVCQWNRSGLSGGNGRRGSTICVGMWWRVRGSPRQMLEAPPPL